MHTIFESDDSDAVLLIDASNTFNALNRTAAPHNIRILCPIIAIYDVNTYRQPARLVIIGGKEIASAEETTQGDPLAMGLYALSIQRLITSLQAASSMRQCFADDASGAGSITKRRTWWDAISTLGPDFGYFPNDGIIAKPAKEKSVRETFKDTFINETVQEHLGVAVGLREYLEERVSEKVTNWVNDIAKLAEFALCQPQACFAAYTFGLRQRWMYFLRTLPNIQDLLEPLEDAISHMLIPKITERKCNKLDRNILFWETRPLKQGANMTLLKKFIPVTSVT